VAEILATESELAERRSRVAQLRLRRMSLSEIGRQLGVSEATICRDLEWIRLHRQRMFGASPTLDPAELVGDSVELFQDVEAAALLYGESDSLSIRDRLRCLSTAMSAREKRLALLQSIGLICPTSPRPHSNLPTAAEIRMAIESSPIETCDVIHNAEHAWQSGDSVPLTASVDSDRSDGCC
jgi:hypothetical protein